MIAWVTAAAAGAGVAVAGLVGALWWRGCRRRRLKTTLRRISWSRLSDIVLPDDVDGEIHLDLLLLTPAGLVVLDVRQLAGRVYWGERLDHWTAMDGPRRTLLPNPLPGLAARRHAIRALVPDVAIEAFVLLVGDVSYVGDPPPEALTVEDLATRFPARGRGRPPPELAAAWAVLRKAARRSRY